MADPDELASRLSELRRLNPAYHWFCPRVGSEDGSRYFDEDLVEEQKVDHTDQAKSQRQRRIQEAHDRKWLVLRSMLVFSYDGDDAQNGKDWIRERLSDNLMDCDICVREYHRARHEVYTWLHGEFMEAQVEVFMDIFDELSLSRIKGNLKHATDLLRRYQDAGRENELGIRVLDKRGLNGIYEVLHCIPAIRNEDFLRDYFDQPFAMVQHKKRLKAPSCTPAMAWFLWSPVHVRRTWATLSWDKFQRGITASEFEHSVREPLTKSMSKIQLHNMYLGEVPRFWLAMDYISQKLGSDLVTQSLRALEFDACKIALDHLQLGPETGVFVRILTTLSRLIGIAPSDFWSARSTGSPQVWIEQFFKSPSLAHYLSEASGDSQRVEQILKPCFDWLHPFLGSIKPVNQPSTIRPLLRELLDSIGRSVYSRNVKEYCFSTGMSLLAGVLHSLGDEYDKPFARTAGIELAELTGMHMQRIAQATSEDSAQGESCASVIRELLSLDAKCLIRDQSLLMNKQQLQEGACTYWAGAWKEAVTALKPNNLALAEAILHATSRFGAVEPFLAAKGKSLSDKALEFNRSLDQVSSLTVSMLQTLCDFDPADLDHLFQRDESALALFSQLFSSSREVRNGLIDVLKAVTEKSARVDALQDVLTSCLTQVLDGFSFSLRRLAHHNLYLPAPAALKNCREIFENLCNTGSGLLRSQRLDDTEKSALQSFWFGVWTELMNIFSSTEGWSNAGYEKTELTLFCTDVMVFAKFVFDQFPVISAAIAGDAVLDADAQSAVSKKLLEAPNATMDAMVKWLRLRDQQLLTQATDLVCNLLVRLRESNTSMTQTAVEYIQNLYLKNVRSVLDNTNKAKLRRAWENHTGRSIDPEGDKQYAEPKRSTTINLESWTANSQKATPAPTLSKHGIEGASRLEAFKSQAQQRVTAIHKQADQSDFLAKRRAAAEEKRKADLEAAAKRRRAATTQTTDEGSGLAGLGVYDKEHAAPKGANVMVSSDESSEDSEDEMDKLLFGVDKKTKGANSGASKSVSVQPQRPVKKTRVKRNAKDMRARLAPDLSPLHKDILSWEYFHDGPFPQDSSAKSYAEVLDSFRDPIAYQNTFQPLLLLEAWNGFLKAKGEDTNKPFEIKVVNRSTVDAFTEVSVQIDLKHSKDLSEGDVTLLSRAQIPQDAEDEPHALAYLSKMVRKKTHLEVVYRALPRSQLIKSISPNQIFMGLKVMSIVPLEREYGALQGLQYYDLCDEIIKAKPSPLLKYRDETLESIQRIYQLNKAQARSVKSAIDNDCFTLIQGPPGSGKTKTITAIVGAVLTDTIAKGGINIDHATQASKKLLICAPSNAAVDELVVRLKNGVKTTSGDHRKINVVRLGRSDAVSSQVQDVTLDELINKRMNPVVNANNDMREETQKIMTQHQEVSRKLREARAQLDEAELRHAPVSELTPLRKEVDDLKRGKNHLGQKIDGAKDAETQSSRQAEMQKRQIQQDIINESHIICATLSGSGHDMFQNLNVEFETVVIDEAAQCVELSSLIPLKYGCAKCIMVGDPQQLPPTVFSRDAARFKYEQSLFVRMQKNNPENVHLLDTQYRMHPDISTFPSKAFYDGRLLDGPGMAQLRVRPWHSSELLGPFRFFDVLGQQSSEAKGRSLINKAEIRVAQQLYERLRTDFRQVAWKGKIGIITPYKAQLRALRDQFRNSYGDDILDNIEFNTTDAFQGRESEIIIFSCVRASPSGGIGFLNDIRRMNVGLTRAKSSLWVLGNSKSLMNGEFWAKMINHAKTAEVFTQGNVEAMLSRPGKMISKPVEWDGKDGVASLPPSMAEAGRKAGGEPSNTPGSETEAAVSVSKETKPVVGSIKRKPSSSDVDMDDVPPPKAIKAETKMRPLKSTTPTSIKDEDSDMPSASDSSSSKKLKKNSIHGKDSRTIPAGERNDKVSTVPPQAAEKPSKPPTQMPKRALPPHLQKKKPKLFVEKRKPGS